MIYSLRCTECSFESIDKRKFDNHLRLKQHCNVSHSKTYLLFVCSECSACSTSRSIIEEHQHIDHRDSENRKIVESQEEFSLSDSLTDSPEKNEISSINSLEDRKDSTSSVDSDIRMDRHAASHLQECVLCRKQIEFGQEKLIEHFKNVHNLPVGVIEKYLYQEHQLNESEYLPETLPKKAPNHQQTVEGQIQWQTLMNRMQQGNLHNLFLNNNYQDILQKFEKKSPEKLQPDLAALSSPVPMNLHKSHPDSVDENNSANMVKFLTEFLKNTSNYSTNPQTKAQQPPFFNNSQFFPQPKSRPEQGSFNLDTLMYDMYRKNATLTKPQPPVQTPAFQPMQTNVPRMNSTFRSQSPVSYSNESKRKRFDFDQIFSQTDRHNTNFRGKKEAQTVPTVNNENERKTEGNTFLQITSGVVHNTMRKTKSDMKVIQRYIIQTKHDNREIHEMPPEDLNNYVQDFIVTAKKKDGHEYEPESLKAFVHSLERHLKYHNYAHSVLKDNVFQGIRNVLNQRLHELRSQNRSTSSNAMPVEGAVGYGQNFQLKFNENSNNGENENSLIQHKPPTGASLMRDCLLGRDNPQALLNSLWLMNRTQFNVGGTQRHRNLVWGQYNLIGNNTVIQFTSINNETGTSDVRYCRGHGGSGNNTAMGTNNNHTNNMNRVLSAQLQPISCTGSGKRLPMPFNCIEVFQLYASLRPIDANGPNDPFYLCPDPSWEHGGPWFKPIGAGTQVISRIPRCLGLKPTREILTTNSNYLQQSPIPLHSNNSDKKLIPDPQKLFAKMNNDLPQGQNPFLFNQNLDNLKNIISTNNQASSLIENMKNFKNFAKLLFDKANIRGNPSQINMEHASENNDDFAKERAIFRSDEDNANHDSDDGHCSSGNQPNSFDDEDDSNMDDQSMVDEAIGEKEGQKIIQLKESLSDNLKTSV